MLDVLFCNVYSGACDFPDMHSCLASLIAVLTLEHAESFALHDIKIHLVDDEDDNIDILDFFEQLHQALLEKVKENVRDKPANIFFELKMNILYFSSILRVCLLSRSLLSSNTRSQRATRKESQTFLGDYSRSEVK